MGFIELRDGDDLMLEATLPPIRQRSEETCTACECDSR